MLRPLFWGSEIVISIIALALEEYRLFWIVLAILAVEIGYFYFVEKKK